MSNLSISYSLDALRNIYAQNILKFLSIDNRPKIISINELSFDINCFHGKKDTTFRADHNTGANFKYEEYILTKTLASLGLISKNYRHGQTYECDIVDSARNIQIEIVTELKDSCNSTTTNTFSSRIFLGSDAQNIQGISKALKDKFDTKNYVNTMPKGICILSFGDKYSTIAMCKFIIENILCHAPNPSKNFFEKIYLFYYDISREQYYLYHTGVDGAQSHIAIYDIPKFISKKKISRFSVTPRNWYEITLQSKFGNSIKLIKQGNELLNCLSLYGKYIPTSLL